MFWIDRMNKKKCIKAVIWSFGCRRSPTLRYIMRDLGSTLHSPSWKWINSWINKSGGDWQALSTPTILRKIKWIVNCRQYRPLNSYQELFKTLQTVDNLIKYIYHRRLMQTAPTSISLSNTISCIPRRILIFPGWFSYPSWSATKSPTPPNSVIGCRMWHQTLTRQPLFMGLLCSDT